VSLSHPLLYQDLTNVCKFLEDLFSRSQVFFIRYETDTAYYQTATITIDVDLIWSSALYGELHHKMNAFREKVLRIEETCEVAAEDGRQKQHLRFVFPYNTAIIEVLNEVADRRMGIVEDHSGPLSHIRSNQDNKLDEKTAEKVLKLLDLVDEVNKLAEEDKDLIRKMVENETLVKEQLLQLNTIYKTYTWILKNITTRKE